MISREKKRNEKVTELYENERKVESHKTKWQTKETEKNAPRCKNGVEKSSMKSKWKQKISRDMHKKILLEKNKEKQIPNR